MTTKLPDLPAVPTTLDRGTRVLLDGMRQHLRELRGFQGDPNGRALTVSEGGGGGGTVIVVPGNPGNGGSTEPDPTPPPTPEVLQVAAGIDFLFYKTKPPVFSMGHGYARTKAYGAKWPATQEVGPTFANAVLIDEFVGEVGSTPTDPATRWCVWLTWVTRDGVESVTPSGGTNGHVATTGQDPTLLLKILTGQIKEDQLYAALGDRIKLIDAPDTTPGSVAARIKSEATTRANADNAISSIVDQVSATVDGNTAAIQTEATTRANQTGQLFAQYTVKLDVGGKVSGYGLASSSASSTFAIRADRFYIAAPAGVGGVNDVVPFAVQATPTMTPAGELLPAGVYIDAAYVRNLEVALGRFQNAFITNAMVVSLSASRLTSGVISVGNYIQSSNYVPGVQGWRISGDGFIEVDAAWIRGTIKATQIDARGLTIRRPDGTVVLDASGTGSAIGWDSIGGKPDVFTNNLVNLSFWTRLGAIPWIKNGPGEENTLYYAEELGQKGPRGANDVVLYAREAVGDSDAGGGWNAPDTLVLNPTKTYRFVVPILKRGGAAGNAYWGPDWSACDLNTTNPANNPYFTNYSRDAMSSDRWYLFVGYVYPYGSTGNSHSGAGVYDCKTGALVTGGANFNHSAGGVRGHRAYQFYASQGSTQLFGRPLVHVCDGTEPALSSFFESNALLNGVIPTNAGNQFPNSDMRDGWEQLWALRWNQNGEPIATFNRTDKVWSDGMWMPKGVLGLTVNTVNQTGVIDYGITEAIPVVPDTRYELSISFFSHRCGYGIGLAFVDAGGSLVGGWTELHRNTWHDNNSGIPAVSLADRVTVFATAPTGAASAIMFVRKGPQLAGSDSWVWWFWPYFGTAASQQTEPSTYAPGPLRSVRSLGYSGDLNADSNTKIGINASGQFYGGGAGTGTTVSNNQLSMGADGVLYNAGAAQGQVQQIPVIDIEAERYIDRPPSWYGVATRREFKRTYNLSLTDEFGAWCTLETIKQYPDNSGGTAYQYAYVGSRTFRRSAAVQASAWGAWALDLDRNSYTGDLNATNGATIGQDLRGVYTQQSWNVYMPNALIDESHIKRLSVGLISTGINGGSAQGIQMFLNVQAIFTETNAEVITIGWLGPR